MKKTTQNALAISIFLLIVIGTPFTASSQVAINADNTEPDASAMLDVSSNDKGLLIPRLDSTARKNIASPANGLMVYDTSTVTFWYYDNNKWNEIRNGSERLSAMDLLQNIPAEPDFSCLEVVGDLRIGNTPLDMVLSGKYAYVVDLDSEDLKIIEVSNPEAATQVGSLGVGEAPRAVAVSGNYAYICDSTDDDLKVIDVSDPSTPVLVASLDLGRRPIDLDASGNYVYVIDEDDNDLTVVDISSPTSPAEVGSLSIGDEPTSIAASGNYVYIVDEDSEDLKIIDVSTPTAPVLISDLGIGVSPQYVTVSGSYVYVVGWVGDGFKIVDVRNPAVPTISGSIGVGTYPNPSAIAISGNKYAYITDWTDNDLKIIDISDPTNPTQDTTLHIGSKPDIRAVLEDYVFVIDTDENDFKTIKLACTEHLVFNPLSGEIERFGSDDNQIIDKLNLNGTTLEISLQDDGQSDQIVDLANIDTDNQTIDRLNLNGTTLELSLEDDGVSDQTVNLASIDTDNQTVDKFELSGNNLLLSLEDDGQSDVSVDLTNLLVPIGTIQMWPTSTAPDGWLICNGGTFNASTYPELNSVLGGNTLPNFNGRFPLGVGNSGTTGSTSHSIKSTGGEEEHFLTIGEMPSHNHGITYTGRNKSGSGGEVSDLESSASTTTTENTGGNQAHNNMPPFYTINFIIKAK